MRGAADELLPLVYQQLRELAAHRLAREEHGRTLQATELVHEAYLRLVGTEPQKPWQGRGHFFAAAAEAMRRLLIDRARDRKRLKRGGDVRPRRLDLAGLVDDDAPPDDLIDLDEALTRLSSVDARAAEAGQAPALRRPLARRGRGRLRCRPPHRRARLGLRPGLAVPATFPAPGISWRSAPGICGGPGSPLRVPEARSDRFGAEPRPGANLALPTAKLIPAELCPSARKNPCRTPGADGALFVGVAVADPKTLSRCRGGRSPMDQHKPDLKTIFGEAMEHPAGPNRLAYLDRACRDNPALRGQVDALLAAHEAPAASSTRRPAPPPSRPPMSRARERLPPAASPPPIPTTPRPPTAHPPPT